LKFFYYLIIPLVLLTIQKNEEYISSENFKFRFIKANKSRGYNYGYTIRASKEYKKVQVRLKIKSLSGENDIFDANKFYLVSEKEKTRIMPIDVRNNYAAGWIFVPFDYLVDYNDIYKKLEHWLSYKPEIKNTFLDYKIKGYKDICPTINFGTKRKPITKTPYFDHKELKSCKLDVYFSLPKDIKNIKIFYGDVLLKETNLKK
jgi:hypothetical protein